MAARRRSLAVELETKQPAAAAAREAEGEERGEGTSMPKHLAMAGEAA